MPPPEEFLRPAADCERIEQRRNGPLHVVRCDAPQKGAGCQRISTYCEPRRPLHLLSEPPDLCSQHVLLKVEQNGIMGCGVDGTGD
jgi:hypothetical protein